MSDYPKGTYECPKCGAKIEVLVGLSHAPTCSNHKNKTITTMVLVKEKK